MNARTPTAASTARLNTIEALRQVSAQSDDDIFGQLSDDIAIPAKSPMFDPDWAQHGYIDTVVRNAFEWMQAQQVPGLSVEIIRLERRTPVLFFELAASHGNAETIAAHANAIRVSSQTVLVYGHLDKQPEFTGWRSDMQLARRQWCGR